MKGRWQGLLGLLVVPLFALPVAAADAPPGSPAPLTTPAPASPGVSAPGNAPGVSAAGSAAPGTTAPGTVPGAGAVGTGSAAPGTVPGAPLPGVSPALPDYTAKLAAKPGMELTYSIHDGIDTHRKKLGDYQFTAVVEPKARDCALSYKWDMSAPAAAGGIRAISKDDLAHSKDTSFFYEDKQECTLDGFTSIVRVSDDLYRSLKSGSQSEFGSDGPDVVMINHQPVRPAAKSIHKTGEEQLDLMVNNKQVKVDTIKVETDNGWTYWILDNARFPMMVKGDGPIRWDPPNIIVSETPEPTAQAGTGQKEGKRIVNDLKKKGTATTRAILFDFDKASLKPSAKPILNELSQYLNADQKVRLSIEGHTDNVGGAAYNLNLSQRRANAVRDYLIKTAHINAARFKTKGYGFTKPVADNKTAAGRALNRRVVFAKL